MMAWMASRKKTRKTMMRKWPDWLSSKLKEIDLRLSERLRRQRNKD